VYLLLVIGTMFLFPILSIILEISLGNPAMGMTLLIGKWFVFWAVGVRLFVAGLSQAIRPAFTAENIFGIKNKESHVLVQELGFSNVAMGVAGLISILDLTWVLPIAVAAAVFYALAGIKHMARKQRSPNENVAMVSDLVVAIVLAYAAVGRFTGAY